MFPDWLLAICLPLATWRLSHMLVNEAGPFAILETLRFRLGAGVHDCATQRDDGTITNVLCCTWCVSVWVAALMLITALHVAGQIVIVWLALSATAILIDRIVRS